LTRNEAACIRNSREYKEIMTQKNGVYFTTNSLRDLNREFDQATQAYDRMQRGLVGEVVEVAGRFNSEILSFAAPNFL
jgi:DNA mismatch repair ATPase MutS